MRSSRLVLVLAGVLVAPLVLAHCVGDAAQTTIVAAPDGGSSSLDGASGDGTKDAGTSADSQASGDAGAVDAGPKQVFVTSQLFDGMFNPSSSPDAGAGGGATADARCMAAAATPFPGRTFHAWIAIGTASASSRVGPGPWYVGNQFFGDVGLLTNAGSPPVAPLTENGQPVDDPKIAWTGTDVNGAAADPADPTTTCSDWTDPSPQGSGNVGVTYGANGFWTDSPGSNPCSSYFRIYCFEE